MTIEYGLFSDEGLIESGFYSVEEAEAAITERYDTDDGLEVEEICHDHPNQPHRGCELCDIDDEAEEDDETEE